jgi:hypothetical protein
MAGREEYPMGYTKEEWEMYQRAKNTADYNAVDKMRDERRKREREEELKEQWPSTAAARMFTQLAETFGACQRLVEQDPEIQRALQLADGEKHNVFTMLRENLEKANRAPRCEHQKSNGQMCRAPKMRGQKYCCMHLAMEAARPTKFSLPALDDANAIQVAITKGAQGLVDGTLEEKRATRLAYYLQLAMSNVGRVNFEPEEVNEEVQV